MLDSGAVAYGRALLVPGQELLHGRLVVRGILGTGSTGIVYAADDRRLERPVAVKTLSDFDGERLYQLKCEFRTLARLSHRNLVQLYELSASDGVWCLIMELVSGMDMGQWLRGRPSQARTRHVLAGLFEGLRVLHASGHVHRDVKPSNVMITPENEAVLLDFGLAGRIKGGPMTMPAGTLDYIAPEQLREDGGVGPAADWYSFGVVVFEALTGRLPFAAAEKVAARDRGPTLGNRPLPQEIPLDLVPTLRALLDPDPSHRPSVVDLSPQFASADRPVAIRPPIPELPFVGRQHALDQLHRALAEARRNEIRIVHVHGASGIGKSALIRRFIEEVRGHGAALVLEGACHPQESLPFKALDALIDNLARYLLGIDDAAVDRLAPRPRDVGALLDLFPVLGRLPSVRAWLPRFNEPADNDAAGATASLLESRRTGVEALCEMLRKLSDVHPIVLWIDDIQWSDRDSGTVLQALVGSPESARVLLLLTSRDDQPGAAALIAAFDESIPVSEIHLEPLSPDESRQLARELSSEISALDADTLAEESGGSPFLLAELVRHLRDAALRQSTRRRLSVADVVRSRLDALTAPARKLVEVLAIAGRPLETDLALQIVGAGGAGHLLTYALCADYLLRITTQGERTYLDTYHDRIREIAVAGLRPEQRKGWHHDLASAIRASRNPDARTLVKHYLGSEEPDEAAHFAAIAAEQAERDLAFDQAAEMYDVVLALRAGARSDLRILERRALMLAHAARRAEAGLAYEEAARVIPLGAQGEQRLSMRGQAAEQYFCGGELRKGLSVLHDVLDDVGVHIPDHMLARLAAGQWLRAKFMVRGYRLGRRADATYPGTLARLDALWGATRGVVMLDHTLADVLAGRHLLDALRVGDTTRSLRALGLEAAFEANIGGRWFRRRSARILSYAEQEAARHGSPYDLAWLAHCKAACAWFEGQWEACCAQARAAEELLTAVGAGASWDLMVLHGFVLSSLAHLGNLRQLSVDLKDRIQDAERRQDQYALRVFRTGDAVIDWLARDQMETALSIADATLADIPTDHFTSQHRHHLVAAVLSHLYAGDSEGAWDRIEQAWTPLRWSGFLLLDCMGTQLRYLRACAALARLRAERPGRISRSRLLDIADREMRRIGRSRLPMAKPMASAVAAGIAGARQRIDEQIDALRAAGNGFKAAGMTLHQEAARWHLAALTSDVPLREAVVYWMTSQAVVKPTSLACAVVPPP